MYHYDFKYNNDLAKLSQYAAGGAIVSQQSSPFGGFGFMAGLTILGPTYNGAKWLYKNYGNYQSAWDAQRANNIEINKLNQSFKGNNIFETMMNKERYNTLTKYEAKYSNPEAPLGKEIKITENGVEKTITKDPSKKAIRKYNTQVTKNEYYKEIKTDIEKAKKLRGKELKKALAEIEEKIAKANLEVHNAKINGNLKPTTKTGKALSGVKKYTGMRFISGKTKQFAAKSKTFRTLNKGAKGNAAFAIFSLACEVPELVETYKTLGAGKGTKQLAKTATVVAAETAGYVIGAKAGGMAGAAIGGAIGSVVPVVGNAVGAVVGGLIGVACGLITSHYAGKAAKALVGKSELEKAKEEQANNLFKEIKQSF